LRFYAEIAKTGFYCRVVRNRKWLIAAVPIDGSGGDLAGNLRDYCFCPSPPQDQRDA